MRFLLAVSLVLVLSLDRQVPHWIADEPPSTRPARVSDAARRRVSELSRLAINQIDRHDFPAAEQTLRRALAIVPNDCTCLYNLACVHAAQRRLEDAMDDLERATDAGFTDLSRLEREPVFADVRTLTRYRDLIGRRVQITHNAAQLIVAELRDKLGQGYQFDVDEDHKLVLAATLDRQQLDELSASLRSQARSLAELIFSHPSDEFIRIIVASPAGFSRLEHQPGVGGRYDDATRTVLVKSTGPPLRHEFTHALHAADQHALDQEHPVWLSEGLATLYEYPRGESIPSTLKSIPDTLNRRLFPADTWRLGRVQAVARRDSLVPLADLLKMKRAAFTARADLTYGEAGSLLMYLNGHQQLKDFYRNYTSNFAKEPSGKSALEQTTGMSLDELQKAWVRWLLDRSVPSRQAMESIQ